MAYIYKIVNDINNKIYIGKTDKPNPNGRWLEHQSAAKRDHLKQRHLYSAINKYGIEHFTFSVIEETNEPDEREQYYIELFDTYHSGYNMTLGGDGGKRLELDETAVCTYYKNHTLSGTAEHFNCSYETIERVLYRNSVKKRTHIEACKKQFSKQVIQKDLETGAIIHIFLNTREAERTITGNPKNHGSSISRVCRGERKQAFGYRWEYAA